MNNCYDEDSRRATNPISPRAQSVPALVFMDLPLRWELQGTLGPAAANRISNVFFCSGELNNLYEYLFGFLAN